MASAAPRNLDGGIRILVADDQRVNQLILEAFLRKEGHTVLVANNGSFQQPLGGKTFQMVQVRLDERSGAIPEISANKYLLWIRFTTQDGDLRPRAYDGNVEFELALCNL